MAFRFLHTADLHLGSPLKGLAARDPALARMFDRAVWRAFESMVDVAIAERAAFVLISGDVFDREWKDWSTGQAFTRVIARLPRAGIRVLMIRGNHDAESLISRELPMPEGVAWLSADRPETIDWPDIGVAVHGMSFKEAAVTDQIVARYPPPLPGRFNIGMLHTSLDGRPDVDRYAPASLADLERLGYDYWALGHVHVREVVRPDAPTVVFPGNIQGRSIRETGEKGVTIVHVEGASVTLEHRPIDQARFAEVAVDITPDRISGPDRYAGIEPFDGREPVFARVREALGRAAADAGGRPLAARIRIACPGSVAEDLASDRERLRQELQAVAAQVSDAVVIEKVVVAASPGAARPIGLPGVDLDEVLAAVLAREDLRAAIAEDAGLVRGRMPRVVAEAGDGADTDAVIAAARSLIVGRIGGEP